MKLGFRTKCWMNEVWLVWVQFGNRWDVGRRGGDPERQLFVASLFKFKTNISTKTTTRGRSTSFSQSRVRICCGGKWKRCVISCAQVALFASSFEQAAPPFSKVPSIISVTKLEIVVSSSLLCLAFIYFHQLILFHCLPVFHKTYLFHFFR